MVSPGNVPQTISILIVEDGMVNRRIAAAIVDKMGYRYDLVANGREAVNAVMRFDYHLVLMDCQMPVMDGFDATTSIRALQAGTKRTPIIAMTAMVDGDIRARCLGAGMDDVLAKPFKADALSEMLSRILEEPASVVIESADEGGESVAANGLDDPV